MKTRNTDRASSLKKSKFRASCVALGIGFIYWMNIAEAQVVHKNGLRVPCTNGESASYKCSGLDLLSVLTPEELGASMSCSGGKRRCGVNDMWGWYDEQADREYAIIGREDGTAFVDVTNPTHPVYLGNLPPSAGLPQFWRDIKVYNDHAFIVADRQPGSGMQVFDLRQLRSVGASPVEFQSSAVYHGFSHAHNIAINEESGYAYVVGYSITAQSAECGKGLHIVDISNMLSPTYAGCFRYYGSSIKEADGYTHDAQCVTYHGPDQDYLNREICVGFNEKSITFVDVTDKSAPTEISKATYAGVQYVHQGWLTDDHRYVFQNDELDEFLGSVERTRTLVWDVIDLDDPVLLTEYEGEQSADHNLYINGNLMYQSNYKDGLRIVDISDPAVPREIAYFDTHEDDPADTYPFYGAWSNYPYFRSGAIGITSRDEGFFMVMPTFSTPTAREQTEVPENIVFIDAFPNPFSNRFSISFELKVTQEIEISVFDVLGRLVKNVYTGVVNAGRGHVIDVLLEKQSPGSYFYRVQGKDFSVTKPVTLIY